MRKASAKNLKALGSRKTRHAEKHHNGEMEPPARLEPQCMRLRKIHRAKGIRALARSVQSGVSALIEITREDVIGVLDEAKERFILADAALKSFRFSYPAKPEEFEQWKQLREAWD